MQIAVAVGLLLLLAASLETGFRWGRRALAKKGETAGGYQLGAIQGAILGLLALLLGFSFAGAASRFIERQDLIVQEANAIGTAWLRADLLDEPYRSDLRAALAEYVEHRLEASKTLGRGVSPEMLAEVDRLRRRIWQAASQGTSAKPSTMVSVLAPVNETIDLHATRLAAGRKHLPRFIMGLLVACSALAVGTIGFGCGLGGHRNLLMTASLAVLIAASLWITIDLDYPRLGMIQVSDLPLKELRSTFSGPTSTRPSPSL